MKIEKQIAFKRTIKETQVMVQEKSAKHFKLKNTKYIKDFGAIENIRKQQIKQTKQKITCNENK